MAIFAVQIRFIGDTDARLNVRPSHRSYLADLYEQGKLVTAGPWVDDTGALLVYEAADEAEVRDLLAADPYTDANVYEIADVRAWNQVFPVRS